MDRRELVSDQHLNEAFHNIYAKLNNSFGFAHELKVVIDAISELTTNTTGEMTAERVGEYVAQYQEAEFCTAIVLKSLAQLRQELVVLETALRQR